MKHIVIISAYYAPAWSYGGPPKVLSTLAKALVKQRNTVSVITTDALDEQRNPINEETLDGIEIHRFNTLSNGLAYKAKLFIVPGIASKVLPILKTADYVLFSDTRTVLNWQLYNTVKTLKIPYGVFAFGQIPYDRGWRAVAKQLFDFLWVRDFMKSAVYHFAQTPHEARMYQEWFGVSPRSIYLVPLPLDKRTPPSGKKLLTVSSRWHIGKEKKIILFVGRLNYLKGIDLLLLSVLPLLEKDSSLCLVIVGREDGMRSQDIQKSIPGYLRSQVVFTGPLYDADIAPLYRAAFCFVITPRYYEETSTAALEALAYGTPVVTTEEADIPYLQTYGAGFVVSNDIAHIQDAIGLILNKDQKSYDRMRRQAKKLIEDVYGSRIVARRLSAILTKGNV